MSPSRIATVSQSEPFAPIDLGIRSVKVPQFLLRYVLIFLDASVIVLTGAASIFFAASMTEVVLRLHQLLGIGFIAALLYVLLGEAVGLYDLQSVRSKRKDTGQIIGLWLLVSILLTAVAVLMKDREVVFHSFAFKSSLLILLLLLISRRLSKQFVQAVVARGRVRVRRAILVGTHEELSSLDAAGLFASFGAKETDRIVLPGDDCRPAVGGSRSFPIEYAISAACAKGADEIVLALPWSDTRKLAMVRDRLRIIPLPIRLLPDHQIRSLATSLSSLPQCPLPLEVQCAPPLSATVHISKRATDIVGATIGLIILSPLMFLTAVAIKIDSPGPIFFRQRRNGFNSRQFYIYKFRSMAVMEDGPAITQAKRFDPRVTKVGRVLRRTSIDEIPQLLNVLRGEMSLVGPRPHAIAHDNHYEELVSDYALRYRVKPGMTGWAQIKGHRGETANVEQMEARVDCDLWYIDNWSIALDWKILLLTSLELIRRRNAY
ncbi:exopolysaccharide biosynthesis polyprenyl glycosylphosphotransferase [Bradyrhizobium sp. URHC0002]